MTTDPPPPNGCLHIRKVKVLCQHSTYHHMGTTQMQYTSCTCNSVQPRGSGYSIWPQKQNAIHIFVMALMQSEMPEQRIWLCGEVNFMRITQHMLEHTHTCMHRTQHVPEHTHTCMHRHNTCSNTCIHSWTEQNTCSNTRIHSCRLIYLHLRNSTRRTNPLWMI